MSLQTGEGAIFARLAALHPKSIDLSLERLRRLLEKLGHPESKLPPVIHIAGTNGKGSVTAFCRAFLEAAGKSVHVYTSPHLMRFNERIRLAGKIVGDARLNEALEHCERVNAGAPITFFEITTAVAFYLFAQEKADTTLLEVGLGGKFDATNVIAAPMLTVLTPISIDHCEYLGDTLEQITREKAGILKRQVPCILAQQEEAAKIEIEKAARQTRSPLFSQGEHWSVSEERGRLIYQDEDGLLDLPAPKLLGRHQFNNAACAIAIMRTLDKDFPHAALEAGLRKVEWPARLQRLSSGRLVEKAPRDAEIWLDGGHNAAAAEAIAQEMAEREERAPRPLILIAGMLKAKQADRFFRAFAGLAAKVLTVRIPETEDSYAAEDLAAIAEAQGLDAAAMLDVATALAAAGALDKAPRILICGSLYLAGAVLSENGTPP